VPNAPVAAPTLAKSTKLGLKVNPADAASAQVAIGDTEDQVTRVFYPPKDAYDFRDLPPGFQQPYRASGFQNKTSGFGAIYYDSHLAEATLHEDLLTLEQVNASEAAYEKDPNFGTPFDTERGLGVFYWFWDDADHQQTMMMCAVQDKTDPKKFDLTTAIGDNVVMEALRMNPASAKEDRLALQHRATNLNPPNSPRT
jgi:hypothetical protein